MDLVAHTQRSRLAAGREATNRQIIGPCMLTPRRLTAAGNIEDAACTVAGPLAG